jgi:hypothetical protein
MTTRPDTDRQIRAFLEDNRVDLPDHVYDVVRGQIEHKRQRVVIGPWREEHMGKLAIFGIAAAAVVLVAVVGTRLLPTESGVGGAPIGAATPTPAATPKPAAWAASPGPVAAGTYYIPNPPDTNLSQLTFTLPAGWTSADIAAKDPGTAGEVMFTTWAVTDIFPDACKWSEANVVNVGTSVDQFMTALAGQKSRTASAVTDTTLAGFPGKQITMTVAPTLKTSTCTDGNLRYWPAPGPDFGGGMCCNQTGNIDVVSAIDVLGKRVVVIARHYPGSSSASLAELQSVVDSIRIQP